MKYTKPTLLLLALFSFSFTTSAAQCPIINRSLLKTTPITTQERATLTDLFKKEGITATTTGANIFTAISQFQKKYNLEVVSTVGPKTRTKINELITKNCNLTAVIATSSSPVAPMPVPTVAFKDVDPEKLDLLNPNGGEDIVQGMGRTFDIVWLSKNLSADSDVTIELLGENLDIVIKTWNVKNTGKFTLSSDEVDRLAIGWFYMRIKHYCNSPTIACSEDTSEKAFVVYPPTGWVAGAFNLDNFKSGEKYNVTSGQGIPVKWYSYSKDYDYYKVYLGNVVLGKEVFVRNVQGAGDFINNDSLKELKKGITKSDFEIQNAYYVKVQVAKRDRYDGPDKVMKESVSGQFGIR